MKKFIIILTLGLLLVSGCAKQNIAPNITKRQSDANDIKASTQSNLDINKINSTNNKTNEIDTVPINNSFFFKNNISQLNYKGTFLFKKAIQKEVKVQICEIANLKTGKLYELKLDSIEGVPTDRLSLGYFYVQKDKIYKIEPTEENLNKLKTSDEVPNGSAIVCQDKELKDTLGKDEAGWHHYIDVNGDKREYHSYNKVSTGYYESFTWEMDKGLINYRSGYGAERDSIELKLSN